MTTVAVTVLNSEVLVEVTEPNSQPAAASAVSFNPTGSIAATNVQAALAELDDGKVGTADARLADQRVPTAAGLTSQFSTGKATIVDTDRVAIFDSAATNAPKHSLFSLVKSTLKTYYDGFYVKLTGGNTISGNQSITGDLSATGAVTANSGGAKIYSAGLSGAESIYSGIWFAQTSPNSTNYTVLGALTESFINAPFGGTLYFRVGNDNIAMLNISSGFQLYSAFGVTGIATFSSTIIAGAAMRLKSYTVATLPAAPTQGDTAFVTNALTPAYLAPAMGGGAIVAPVIYNGTQWVTH